MTPSRVHANVIRISDVCSPEQNSQFTQTDNVEERSGNYCRWKANPECVCNLSYASFNAACGIILKSVFCPALPYFYTLSHKRNDFRKNVNEHKLCLWFSLHLLSETFLILGRIQGNIIINLRRSLHKVTVIPVRL